MGCEQLIDVKQAAELLKLHPNTVQRLARQGKIPALRLGRVWRFRAAELDRWVRLQLDSSPLPLAPSPGEIE